MPGVGGQCGANSRHNGFRRILHVELIRELVTTVGPGDPVNLARGVVHDQFARGFCAISGVTGLGAAGSRRESSDDKRTRQQTERTPEHPYTDGVPSARAVIRPLTARFACAYSDTTPRGPVRDRRLDARLNVVVRYQVTQVFKDGTNVVSGRPPIRTNGSRRVWFLRALPMPDKRTIRFVDHVR
jgi:hypothetical protein